MIENELYRVIDNPEYFDRYTLCFMGPDGPFIYGASDNPFHPLGFGQFCGDGYIPDDHDIGQEIPRDSLPSPVERLALMIEGEPE
jgi:hypothetical protein